MSAAVHHLTLENVNNNVIPILKLKCDSGGNLTVASVIHSYSRAVQFYVVYFKLQIANNKAVRVYNS